MMFQRLAGIRSSASTFDLVRLIIRISVGAVFVSEGIQKYLYPNRGALRFEGLGLPAPETLALFVATTELVCGLLVLVGLLTRISAIPLFITMVMAIVLTKIPILAEQGFWEAAHASRTDYAMLLGATCLIIAGAGRWSVDSVIARRADA